jgi:hypothetical protein
MNEVEKKKALTTADLAAVSRPPDVKPGPGPARRREYEEEPRSQEGVDEPRERHPLFAEEEIKGLRAEWEAIQIGFVDEPRKSVEKADGLVANVIQRLAAGFSEERARLETQWDRGEDVSTEDLRVNLQRYRSFFDRLLSL